MEEVLLWEGKQLKVFPDFEGHQGNFSFRNTPVEEAGGNALQTARWTNPLEYEGESLLVSKSLSFTAPGTIRIDYQFNKPLPSSAVLRVRPSFAVREHHSLCKAKPHFEIGTANLNKIRIKTDLHQVPFFTFERVDSKSELLKIRTQECPPAEFYYEIDAERGFEAQEILENKYVLELPLAQHSRGASIELGVNEDVTFEKSPSVEHFEGNGKFDELRTNLGAACETFLTWKSGRRTIIAGYPWFEDWGRDTFISLTGICLVRGHFQTAKDILRGFAELLQDGLIPNCFGSEGERSYNNVDGTLWFLHAAANCIDYTQDLQFAQEFFPVAREIFNRHVEGTHYKISVDPTDGLLQAGMAGVQLTWMDAKVGAEVITPRMGKPIEVNALWISTLRRWGGLAEMLEHSVDAKKWNQWADRANNSFLNFWCAEYGWFSDVRSAPLLGIYSDDKSLRPNQVIALSLPGVRVPLKMAQSALTEVRNTLLIPFGLRTLSPFDPQYKPCYRGSPEERDRSYHQGIAWPWLFGSYVTATRRHFGDIATSHLEQAFERFAEGLGMACYGHFSELHDPEPPFAPKGAPAQAWSVAEPLRALIEDVYLKQPNRIFIE
jgi:predicted glycogen debranching enzyme